MKAAGAPFNYWNHGGVAWGRVWTAFCDPKTEMITETNSPFRLEPVRQYGNYFATPGHFEQWVVAQDPATLLALHLKTQADRFLVFDIDLRDMTHEQLNVVALPTPRPMFQARCQHTDIQLCPGCWPLLRVAVYWIDRRIRRACLGLESPGLVVFSGNNGAHIWYPLQTPEERYDTALHATRLRGLAKLKPTTPLSESDTREIQALLPPDWPLSVNATLGMLDIDSQPLKPGHLIRFPMSLNPKSGRASVIMGWSHEADRLRAPYITLLERPVEYSMQLLTNGWHPPAPTRLRPVATVPLPRVVTKKRPRGRKAKFKTATELALIRPPAVPAGMRPGTYIQMGTLVRSDSGALSYGDRSLVLLDHVLRAGALRDYSLIIPILLERNDIPSEPNAQAPFLSVVCRRYFGLIDADTDFTSVLEGGGGGPLFVDQPDSSVGLESIHKAKLKFVARMKQAGYTFEQMAHLCRPFRPLLDLVIALAAHPALIVFYSGGAGFRVLFHSPFAWRRVYWGDSPAYAERYKEHVMRAEVLTKEPLNLPPNLCDVIALYTDRNVYEKGKGIKPDVHRHFETGLWPRRVPTINPESCREWHVTGADNVADTALIQTIETFWHTVLTSAPTVDDCPWMKGDETA